MNVNPYHTRGGKLLFIPQVNATHYGIRSLRYNVPGIGMTFSEIPTIIRTSVTQIFLNLNIT